MNFLLRIQWRQGHFLSLCQMELGNTGPFSARWICCCDVFIGLFCSYGKLRKKSLPLLLFKGLRLTAGRRPKGGYVGPTCGSLGQVRPMFAYVSRRLPQVGPMLALCSPMIAHVGPMLALCGPKLALSCPYVGLILVLCCPIMSTNFAELC